MSKSYMTLDEVAEKLDLDKSEVQGLITKEKLNVSYCWTPKGIRISRKSFEENWGDYSVEEAESAADTNMSVAEAVTKAMGSAIGRMMNARSEFRSVKSDNRRYYTRVNND